jgi:hypothetical protein
LEILALINAHHIYNSTGIVPALENIENFKQFNNLLYNNHRSTLRYFLCDCAILLGGMQSVSISDQVQIKPKLKRLFYNSEEGQSKTFSSLQKHEIVFAATRAKCTFCSTGRPRYKCSICEIYLCTRKKNEDEGSKTCFETFHDAFHKLKCKEK